MSPTRGFPPIHPAGHGWASRVSSRPRLRRGASPGSTRPDTAAGSGLTGLKDRIEALGGTFSLHSPKGGGTAVSCELPVPARGGRLDAGHVK